MDNISSITNKKEKYPNSKGVVRGRGIATTGYSKYPGLGMVRRRYFGYT